LREPVAVAAGPTRQLDKALNLAFTLPDKKWATAENPTITWTDTTNTTYNTAATVLTD
jgi:hypothetical protein